MVLGFGALNLDLIYEVDRLSLIQFEDLDLKPGSETILAEEQFPKFSQMISRFGDLKRICPGGSASNTCYMLSLLGFETAIFGVLGEDSEGDEYLNALPPNIERLITRRGKTGLAYIVNERETRNKDRTILLLPRSNSDILPEDVREIDIGRLSWIHMSSFAKREAFIAQKYMKQKAYGSCGLSIDPGEVYSRLGRDLLELIEGFDILFCSEKELNSIFGKELETSLKEALSLVRMVVLKRGKEGASLFRDGKHFHVKAHEAEPVDTTGAGDVLNGVFLACLLRNESPEEALRKAVRAASRSVTGYGRDGYIYACKEISSC